MGTRTLTISMLAAGVVIAVTGYALIGFSCPYSFLSTVMTGRIVLLHTWLLPYKWVLALALSFVIEAIYLWARDPIRVANPLNDPALLASLGAGVATIGFLMAHYPCPFSADLLFLLALEVPLGVATVPYGAILAFAACLLLYAGYARARTGRNTAR